MATEMNIIKRLKGETPKFFKVIIKIGLSMLGIGIGIIATSNQGIVFPEDILKMAEQFIWIGTIASIIAKLTIQEPKKKETIKEVVPEKKEITENK